MVFSVGFMNQVT